MDPDRRGSTTTPPLGHSTVYSQTQCSGVIQYKYHRKYTDRMLDICGVVEEKYGAGEEQRTTAQTQRWQHSKKQNQNKFKKKKKNTAHAYMCRKVKLNHHRLSCHFAHLSMGQKTERNRVDGGGLTSCIWALKSAHEDNWKDCIITWATACGGEHTAHSSWWSGTDSTHSRLRIFFSLTQTHTHQHTLWFFLNYVRDFPLWEYGWV